MSKCNQSFTTVSSTGRAITDYEVVSFSLSFSEIENTAAEAKGALSRGVGRIKEVMATLEKRGMKIVPDSFKSSLQTSVHRVYERDKWIKKGYKADYGMLFQTDTLAMVNDIYEALSSLELSDLEVANPVFKVKDLAAFHRIGLQKAWEENQRLLIQECEVLGLDRKRLEIDGYTVRYDDSEGLDRTARTFATAALGASNAMPQSNEGTVELLRGKANVRVELSVRWVLRG